MAFVDGVPSGTATTASAGPLTGGRDWRSRALFLGPGPNQAPTASFTASCAGRACSFDASGSTDADGSVTGYSWNFGDGTTATGATATRTYPTDGVRSVTLTVTDDRGATAQAVQSVDATAPPAGTGIGLRAAVGTSARGVTTVSVTVPATVAAGDGLVLVLSTSSDATGTAPAGFVLEGSQTSAANITTQVWSRPAVAGDAGTVLTVPLNKSAKVTLQLAAYSGTVGHRPGGIGDRCDRRGRHGPHDADGDRGPGQLGPLDLVGQAGGRAHVDAAGGRRRGTQQPGRRRHR